MCDFKPGDEVTLIKEPDAEGQHLGLQYGQVYTVKAVFPLGQWIAMAIKEIGLTDPFTGFNVAAFRKVQRRRSDAAVERLKSLCDDPGKLIEKTHAERVACMQEEFRTAMRAMFGEWGDVE